MNKHIFSLLAGTAFLPLSAVAQDHSAHQHGTTAMPTHHHGHAASGTAANQNVADDGTGADGSAHHANPVDPLSPYVQGSGTSRLPASDGTMSGLHVMSGDWMLMAHGYLSGQYTDHAGPRGDDKAYVVSMAMLMAERETSFGKIQLRSMLSLDPLMSNRGYPNLFATGETADSIPLVDRQHPHDLFMELAARVDFKIGSVGGAPISAFLYGGPVGEPALGPSAFMMRRSSRYNPEAPIAHHWFDSTHITYGVVTAGLSAPAWQLETSAFRGAEPDEQRWDIESPKLDSWSVRATWTPSPRWAVQASYGQIHEPEAIHRGQDEHRFTASAHYSSPNGLSAMTAFSSKNRQPGDTLTAWLAEANWDIDPRNSLFARAENVANDELFIDHDDPLHDVKFRVSKFQAGYARRVDLHPFSLALGGSINAYVKPDVLDEVYGRSPWGYTIFARLSLGS